MPTTRTNRSPSPPTPGVRGAAGQSVVCRVAEVVRAGRESARHRELRNWTALD